MHAPKLFSALALPVPRTDPARELTALPYPLVGWGGRRTLPAHSPSTPSASRSGCIGVSLKSFLTLQCKFLAKRLHARHTYEKTLASHCSIVTDYSKQSFNAAKQLKTSNCLQQLQFRETSACLASSAAPSIRWKCWYFDYTGQFPFCFSCEMSSNRPPEHTQDEKGGRCCLVFAVFC